MRKLCILGILVVFFAGFLFSVVRMENLRADGTNVLLPLAPVDPRALLMGDYMTLEYAANWVILAAWREESRESQPDRAWTGGAALGKAVMQLTRSDTGLENDVPPVAQFVRLDDGTPLEKDEVYISFKVLDNRIVTAANAYYFEEGTGRFYERAAFGRIAVGPDGKTLLLALCDATGQDIRPVKTTELPEDIEPVFP